ncbi:MAG: FprA family A-type flavoprotein [Candidatus Helarchaeota archaeon]
MKIEIADKIYFVGIQDWNLRNFHGYSTHRGSTYNSYLIMDDKIALIDQVKGQFTEQFINNVKEIVNLDKIDYLICNHLEGDHSQSLATFSELAKNAQIVTSERGKPGFLRMYKKKWDIKAVKEGDTIKLGKRTLTFIPVPMVHWPDSMVTYCTPDNILFSNDAFGQHICRSKIFDDQNDLNKIMDEAKKYYANIVMHVSSIIMRVLKKVSEELKLDIKMIAPSHGVIWRSNVDKILEKYMYWAGRNTKEKVLIIYATMWHSTEKMAFAILEGIKQEGVEAKLYNINITDNSDIIKEVLDSKGLLIGTPTINNGMFPSISGFLTYLKGLRPPAKIASAFGSYGWSPKGGVEAAIEELKQTKIPEIIDPIKFQFIPDPEEFDECVEWGRQFAKKIKSL